MQVSETYEIKQSNPWCLRIVYFLKILRFKVSPYVTAYYDAFAVYGQVLKETIEAGQDYNDAHEINQRMWNRTFDG